MDKLNTQTPAEARAETRNIRQVSKPKNSGVLEPYEPYEVNEHQGLSQPKPTFNPTTDSFNPAKEETLGQNQVADIVSDGLRSSMAWDSSSGQWFRRAAIDKPFIEYDAESCWLAISEAIGQIKPKYTASFVSGVERFVKAQLSVAAWDTNRYQLPVSNGVLNLKTQTLREYRPSDRFNWQLPYPYDPLAKCPTIEDTLTRMVGGDPELVRFLESWLLVVLLGRYDVQAFLELVGDGGTGKSTFLRLLAFLVGDENVRSTDLYSLETNRFETAGLYGKRLTLITDSARYRGEVPILKAITGGDPVRLERKNQQQCKPYVYQGLVAIAANQPLESSDYSSGLNRRRRALSINYRVSKADRQKYRNRTKFPHGFEGVLQSEMPGLLNRLLSLNINDAVNMVASPDTAMEAQGLAVELETNPLLAWADEKLVKCSPSEAETKVGDKTHRPDEGMYSNYCDFIDAIGQRPVSMTRFSRALLDVLRAHGINTSKARSSYTYLHGLRLRKVCDDAAGLVSGTKRSHVGLRPENGAVVGFVRSAGSKNNSDSSKNNDHQTKLASRGGVL